MRQLSAGRISIACPVAFLKQNNRVSEALSFSVKTSRSRCKAVCARLARFRAKARPGGDPGRAPVRVKKTRQSEETEPRFWTTSTETLERKDGLKVPNALAFANGLAVL